MIRTYIRAPNWTTAPPPTGPIKLGHLLSSLDEFKPINQDAIFPVPKENPVDVKGGCVLNCGRALDGELGVFAQFLAISGLGFNISLRGGKERTTELSFETFETMSFTPDDRYIEDIMNTGPAKSYMEKNDYKKPLFLLTGLKIGRKGSMTSSKSTNVGVSAEVAVPVAPAPVDIGPRISFSNSQNSTMSYKTSSDFIVAFQVTKVRYKRGSLTHQGYRRKAEYHGSGGNAILEEEQAGSHKRELDVIQNVSVTDFDACSELWEGTSSENSEENVLWIVPKAED